MMRDLSLMCFFLLWGSATGDGDEGGGGLRTLIVLEELSVRSTHSIFFRYLEERGHTLQYIKAEDLTELSFTSYGEYLYDNMVLFSGGIGSDGGRKEAVMLPEATGAILAFVDGGKNLILAVSPYASEVVREVALDCGVSVDEELGYVQDHFVYDDEDDGSHTLISSSDFMDAEIIVGKGSKQPVLFKGTGLAAVEGNPLVMPVLKAPATAYTYGLNKPIKDVPLAIGSKTLLVAASQARNNARIIVTGSVDMLGDKALTSQVSPRGGNSGPAGNQAFLEALIDWAFGGKGQLVIDNVLYRVVDGEDNPPALRVKDRLEYRVSISEKVGALWIPYTYDGVQLEFVMLDPWIRTVLKPDGRGNLSASFQVPDVYGVFQFKIVHNRPGYSFLESTQQVSVRPYRHNEHERFIVTAYPYYASAFSMMMACFAFGLVFLYHSPKQKSD